jgi:NAD(P)H dehydrogenase (quinone)
MPATNSVPDDAPRHVVVLGHPSLGSFNHAVASRYCAAVRACGQHAILRDLYALDFDPRLREDRRPGRQTGMSADVANELSHLRAADVLVLVYPIWFGMPPAIVKGYIDRVMGVALTPSAIRDHVTDSVLRNKRLAIFSSSGMTASWLDEQGQLGALRQAFDEYLMGVFGMRSGGHVHFDAIVEGLKKQFVEENLFTVEEQARKLCSEILAERHEAKARAAIGDAAGD